LPAPGDECRNCKRGIDLKQTRRRITKTTGDGALSIDDDDPDAVALAAMTSAYMVGDCGKYLDLWALQ
jgi:hypothetical protein